MLRRAKCDVSFEAKIDKMLKPGKRPDIC